MTTNEKDRMTGLTQHWDAATLSTNDRADLDARLKQRFRDRVQAVRDEREQLLARHERRMLALRLADR